MYARKKEGSRAGGFDLGGFYESAVIEVWPENWPAVDVFSQLATQWQASMNGITGLNYASLFGLLDRRYQNDEWLRVFDDIRVLEVAALETMRQE